jgi:hypothetical protein
MAGALMGGSWCGSRISSSPGPSSLLHRGPRIGVDDAAFPLAAGGEEHLADDLGEFGRAALGGARERVAAERAEADPLQLGGRRELLGHAVVVDEDQLPLVLDDRTLGGAVDVDERNLLEVDVLPDVELGPVGDREDPDLLALVDLGVVEVPELGSLVLGIPAMLRVAEGEDPLLGAGLLLVAAAAAERGVEAVLVERLLEGAEVHDVGVLLGPVRERADPIGEALLVDVDDHIEAELLDDVLVAELVHRLEVPGRVDME